MSDPENDIGKNFDHEEVKVKPFDDPRLTPTFGLFPAFGAAALCIGFIVYGLWFKDPPAPPPSQASAAATASQAAPNYPHIPEAPFGGIGLGINPSPKGPVIVRAYPDTPAGRAGLQKGDIILSVDGLNVTGQDVATVTTRLRGPAGSTVSLTYSRNDGPPTEVTLTRETLQPEMFKKGDGK